MKAASPLPYELNKTGHFKIERIVADHYNIVFLVDSKGFMERKDMILEMAEDFKIRN